MKVQFCNLSILRPVNIVIRAQGWHLYSFLFFHLKRVLLNTDGALGAEFLVYFEIKMFCFLLFQMLLLLLRLVI